MQSQTQKVNLRDPMYPNILITGLARHGKDTLAAILVKDFGYVKVAFADALRAEIVSAYQKSPSNVDIEYLTNEATKEVPDPRLALMYCKDNLYVLSALEAFLLEDEGMNLGARVAKARSPRRIQQTWGTEYRRGQNEMYWVNVLDQCVSNIDGPVVVSDGRSVSEINWAKNNEVERIHVTRPGFQSIKAQHSSEVIPPPDESTHLLTNKEGDLDWLHYQVSCALSKSYSERSAHSSERCGASA